MAKGKKANKGNAGKGRKPGTFAISEERFYEAIILAKGNRQTTAKLLGISEKTVYNYIKHYDIKAREVLDLGENLLLDEAESVLARKIKQEDLDAVKFYLDRKGRKRGYGLRVDQAITHEFGQQFISQLSSIVDHVWGDDQD